MRQWVVSALLLLALKSEAQTPTPYPYRNGSLSAEVRSRDLVSRMTLEEKTAQMMNEAPAIPRLGVAAYNWWSEGLHGIARAGYSTLFPQAIGLAATWDPDLMQSVGNVVGVEARAKYNDAIAHGNHGIFYGLTIWSPNINILRDPRWGRGQETYGEDPFLTAHLAVPFIRGLQGNDLDHPLTIATPKHFAVHSGPESNRHSEDVHPSMHDLFDTYLPAFRASIVEGHAGSLMCAYNAIDASPACANNQLLRHTLRGSWGFQGFVTSDCGAIDDFFKTGGHGFSADAEHAAAAAVLAGTDTNCGSTYEALHGAVEHGLLKESDLDVALIRLFAARMRLGMFDQPAGHSTEILVNEVAGVGHAEVALRAARESMVLLVNRANTLPLPQSTRRILVVGPNAASLSSLEGNYNAIPRTPVLPVDGVMAAFPSATVDYAQGAPFANGVVLPVPRTMLRTTTGKVGLLGEYFSSFDLTGKPTLSRIDPQLDFDWTAAAPAPGLSIEHFSVRWTGTLHPPKAGEYGFSIGFPECYPCNDREVFRVYLDGKLVSASEPLVPVVSRKTESSLFQMHFPDTRPRSLRIEYRHESPHFGAGFRLDWLPPERELLEAAVKKAREADAIVAFVGLSPLLEGEEMPVSIEGFAGGDRTDLNLPAPQRRLLEGLKATGKPLIVVLMNGSALAVEWAKAHADALLEAWYPGQAGGTAIAQTLSGANNPSGRLPMTFYKSAGDLPPFEDYSMAGRTYRYFRGEALFPFGFGLSYTHFSYGKIQISKNLSAGQPLTINTTVTNDGMRDGEEVVEVYVSPPPNGLSPLRYLAGSRRILLSAGQRQDITLQVDIRTLSTVDKDGNRAIEPGDYRVYVGGSQPLRPENGVMVSIRGRYAVTP